MKLNELKSLTFIGYVENLSPEVMQNRARNCRGKTTLFLHYFA